VLADVAERAEDIDVGRAKEAQSRAEGRMRESSEIDWDRASAALEKAIVRLQVAEMDR
jgi:F-type H+-transporting ATPase subunit epsilon